MLPQRRFSRAASPVRAVRVTQQSRRRRIAQRHRSRCRGPQDVGPIFGPRRYSISKSDIHVRPVLTFRERGEIVSTTNSDQLCRAPDRDCGHPDLLPYLHAVRGPFGPRPRSEQTSHAVPAHVLANTGRVRAGRHVHGGADFRRLPLVLRTIPRRSTDSTESALALSVQGRLQQQSIQGLWRSRRWAVGGRQPRDRLLERRGGRVRLPIGRFFVVPERERGS